MIKILHSGHYYLRKIKQCGDGCCSWSEWENEFCNAGEEYESDEINLDNLILGLDYDAIE